MRVFSVLLLTACNPDTSYVDQVQTDLQAQIDELRADLEAANAQIAAQAAVYCWDLDGSGQCELAGEDLDGDGACTALDCRGPAGDPGAEGAQGAPGLDGANCFDLVGDVNGDGTADADDCVGAEGAQGTPGTQGSAGQDGANCYDLLGDANGDGTADADDCLGAPGAQGPPGTDGTTPDLSAYATLADLQVVADDLLLAARVIDASQEIVVAADGSGDFLTLEEALLSLDDAIITSTAAITIGIEPGVYAMTGTVEVDHRDGDQIFIVGRGAGPGDVILDFGPSMQDGFHVRNGNALGGLDNLTLRGSFAGGTAAGILIIENASARLGGSEWDALVGCPPIPETRTLVIEGFGGPAISVGYGGWAYVVDVLASGNGGGFSAYDGGVLKVDGADASASGVGFTSDAGSLILGAGIYTEDGAPAARVDHGATGRLSDVCFDGTGLAGSGVLVEHGAALELVQGSLDPAVVGWSNYGISASYGATVEALGVRLSNAGGPAGAAVFATGGSSVRADGAVVTGSPGDGFFADDGATIDAAGATGNVGDTAFLATDGAVIRTASSTLAWGADEANPDEATSADDPAQGLIQP
jgi:hypothetical protein